MLLLAGNTFAQSSSANYKLDYERTNNGGSYSESGNFKMVGALTNISAEGESSNYNLRNVYGANFICGNGEVEPGEQCDGSNNGQSCLSYGYSHGTVQCVNCQLSTAACYNPDKEPGSSAICGNAIREANEQCDDGNRVNGDGCNAGCRREYKKLCGNLEIDDNEECDDGNTSSGDGCNSVCLIERPPSEPEPETEFKPEVDEKPWPSIKPDKDKEKEPSEKEEDKPKTELPPIEQYPWPTLTPPLAPPTDAVRPVAPKEGYYKFHFEKYELGETIISLDETPLIVAELSPNNFYEFIVWKNKEVISRQGVQADPYGMVIAESPAYLDYEKYQLEIRNTEHETEKYYEIRTVEDSPYRQHEIVKAGNQDIREVVYLGTFESEAVIEGKGKPEINIYAYFRALKAESENQTGSITFIQVKTGKEGNFEISIPDHLKDGTYQLDITEVHKDETVSRNKRYALKIQNGVANGGKYDRSCSTDTKPLRPAAPERNGSWIIWILIIGALAIVLWRRRSKKIEFRVQKCKNTKTKNISSLEKKGHAIKPDKKTKHIRARKKKVKKKPGKTIKAIAWILILLSSGIFGYTPQTKAVVTTPTGFIYEGKLLNSSNDPITTSHTFRFSIWSSNDYVTGDVDGAGAINTGAATYGSWQETHSVTPNSDGTFFVELGSSVALPDMNIASHQFLQVEIKTNGAADTTYELMDPSGDNGVDTTDRQTIGSSPFAKNADFLDNAEVGTAAGEIALLDSNARWPINFMPEGTNMDDFILDYDDSIGAGGTIDLQFGSALGALLSFDVTNDAFEFNKDVSFEQNQIKNVAIDNLAAAPGSPVAGQIYHNTTNNNTYIWNGSSWDDISAGAGGSDDLDDVYGNDADQKMTVANVNGLEFENTNTGDIVFDLQNTGDLVIEDAGTPFAIFTDGGSLGLGNLTPASILHADSNDANTAAIITMENTAGDVQFFRTDATPESSVTGSVGDIVIDGTSGEAYIKNTGDGTSTGWMELALNRAKEMIFQAEYANGVAEGDGTSNKGILTSEFVDSGGANKYNYYEWTTTQASMQDVDVVLSVKLPDDFVSFTATPLSILYNTNDGTTTNNRIDATLYDTTGTAVTLTNASNLANANWTTANITFGGSPTFTAGQTITLRIKLSSLSGASFARIADVIFNYNSE